ncbi:hypothetical protein GWO53_07195 [Corynebacterium macginleyi]|uniref:LGFP repeat-containing protein n=2 Tax=Corynebacterium macginleyi TaxID=38290 RepID=A0A3M0G3U6_9CORY|nr:hypothetical protein [Corynebacterium macginleyi]MBK4138236.1 hypothetical protein [Corynebacterium macginleyi]MBK4140246.1 hypothetical protein [Corynebacterium macginleyi]MBK4142301.1 hypothetical protein [Corynebacterium macginleyi]MBK4144751.1 hypothetical protein [Corynebacterium macginleyi]MBK4148975.1 hypothetical protein [Corynebacterium macginleyi]
MRKMTRRFVGGFAAATLSIALVACSDAKEAADDAKDAAGSVAADATDAAGSAASKATEAVGSAAAEATGSKDDKADGAKGDTQTITTAHGDEEVPADLAAAVEQKQAEWGEVENVESSDEGTLVAFEGGKYLAYSEQTGVQPVIGKIAETWVNEGGLASSVGLPTKPEAAATSEKGWTQKFSNGTISWTQGDDGKFRADIDA